MTLTEAEIQVLVSIRVLENRDEATDRAAIDKRGERYWIFREDWTGAFESLAAKGLVEGSDAEWRLTETGRPIGEEYRGERADLYWYFYQKFYTAAFASAAHSEFCRRVFGEDRTQESQTDMASMKIGLQALSLGPGKRVLDLGCGAGVIAEYIAETTGAHVTGVDYSASAIEAAVGRTAAKRDLLSFRTANFNTMEAEPAAYDAIVSLDTLYWAADIQSVIGKMAESLASGGRMAIFLNHHAGPGAMAGELAAGAAAPARAASALGLTWAALDFSANIGAFWTRYYAAAKALKADFEAEGNGFIPASMIRECEEDYLPDIHEGRIARYCFLIDAP